MKRSILQLLNSSKWVVEYSSLASDETSIPRLRGDALLVEKSEGDSALIYWNARGYVSSQEGD